MTFTLQMIQVYNNTALDIGEKVNGLYTGALGALQNDLADIIATQLLYDADIHQDFHFITMSTYLCARWLKIRFKLLYYAFLSRTSAQFGRICPILLVY